MSVRLGVLGRDRRSTPTCCWSTRCSPSATPRSSRSASSSSSGSRREGKTIVFVTHDMAAVERFCDRAMLIERGKVRRDRRPARDRARLQRAQLRPARARRRRARAATATSAAAEIEDGWFEDATASGSPRSPQGEPLTIVHGGRASTRPIDEPDLRASRCATSRATPCSRPRPTWRAVADRRASRPASRRRVRVALRQLARAEPLHAHAVGRARGRRATTRSTCARTSRRSSSTARARPAAIVDVPHTLRGRARDERRAPTAAAGRRPSGATARRFWSLTWTLAVDRLEAALLRLGARLRCGRSRGRSRSSA